MTNRLLSRPSWGRNLLQFKAFLKENGHPLIPATYSVYIGDDDVLVGRWVYKIRELFRKNSLTEAEIATLTDAGFEFHPTQYREDQRVKAVKAFFDGHQHYRIPKGKKDKLGTCLNGYILSVRHKYKHGKLTQDEIDYLVKTYGESILTAEPKPDVERLSKLVAYIKSSGDIWVDNDATYEGSNMAKIAAFFRHKHGRGGLPSEEFRVLDDLGFIWDRHDGRFALTLNSLKEYIEATGDTNPTVGVNFNGYNLGTWLKSKQNKEAKGILKTSEREAIEALGVRVKPLRATRVPAQPDLQARGFEAYLGLLVHYMELTGDRLLPAYTEQMGKPLHNWVIRTRAKYIQGKLPSNQIRALESIGFVWSVREEKFRIRLLELAEYINTTGDHNPKASLTFKGNHVGSWLQQRRQKAREGKLKPHHQQAIESLGVTI